jgi:hypothetical protein
MRPAKPSTASISHSYRNLLPGIILLGLVALIAAPALAAESADKWMDHPALQSFDLDVAQLPTEIYLVRTRGILPSIKGIVVHGVRGGLFVVSGDAAAVLKLTERGCAVFPLQKPRAADGPRSTAPHRTWTRITTPDPDIAAMVAQVNWTDVSARIQWLVDMGTRYSYAPNHFAVADSLAGVFVGCGLAPILRSFVYGAATMYNVEATQTGTVYPDSFVVICGHYDSVSDNSMVSAPGADDNGTGTAAVLTAAEILTQYDFEYSIRYICFAGEEQGLRGSQAYASWARAQNHGIVGVLNFDMMGYWEPGVEKDLEIETNVASQWLAAAITNAADLYTGAAYELHVFDGAWWGDHASFWDEGYAAVNHEESWDWGDPDFNPYYHTTSDLLTYIGSDFTVGNIQVGVAALATLAIHVPDGTGVDSPGAAPTLAGSLRAYPNPFNDHLNLTIAGLSNRDNVRVIIYDALGRRVAAVPIDLNASGGVGHWNIREGVSREIGTGVYFAKIEGAPSVAPVKLVHIK